MATKTPRVYDQILDDFIVFFMSLTVHCPYNIQKSVPTLTAQQIKLYDILRQNNKIDFIAKQRQVGATQFLALYALWLCLRTPKTICALIGPPCMRDRYINILKSYLDQLDLDGITIASSKIRFKNGSSLIFPSSLNNIQGVAFDAIIFDEATYIPLFTESLARICQHVKPSGRVIAISTVYNYAEFGSAVSATLSDLSTEI